MTTREPGASEVLTHGLLVSPRATAARASSPAATITEGFEVFVQLVIAAITTAPWSIAAVATAAGAPAGEGSAKVASASWKRSRATRSGTRSCGRRGPAMLGSTSPRSSASVSLKRGSGVCSSCQRPCSRA